MIASDIANPWARTSERLRAALHLTVAPIAITFSAEADNVTPPFADLDEPMPAPTDDGRTGRVPAGCVFWVHALDRTFSTRPDDHGNCSVGSLTHGLIDLETAAQRADVGALVEAGWVAPEIFPQIPVVSMRSETITYGPLAEAIAVPDVVLLRTNARGVMTIGDAVADLVIEGKPQCHIIAIAKEQNRPAASVGCALSRTRTGMSVDEMTCALPGGRVDAIVAAIENAAGVDATVARYAAADAERFARALVSTGLPPLSDRNLGWLRYLHRKATTPDSWEREGHPHAHWDNLSDAPMLCYHRFDLIDSTYAVALMADRTPAWREVYEQILDELIFRHTGWWAAEDWLTQIGDDPERANYPDAYRMLIPASQWGNYNAPGWTANGIEPWGLQWDPIGADGNLFFKGFFLVMLGLHRRVTGNARWDAPFDIVRDGEHTYTWWHTKIAEHLAAQWRAHPEGCHCENTKIWPYCLAGAGFGLQLADLAFGTQHHEAFDIWWEHARREYLHLDGAEPPEMVTFYYDPIIDEHLELPAIGGAIPAIYLAPQVPDEARRLWDAARVQMGMLEVNGPVPVIGPRFTAMALLLARNWAVDDLADALQTACDEHYPPTWDRDRGEVTWDFDLGEEHPRGQYNAMMAAAEVMTEGAWWRLGNVSSAERFDEPTVCDVDFPTVALTRAEWDRDTQRLSLALQPMNDDVVGQPTSMRVTGLDDPTPWRATSPEGSPASVEVRAGDLTIHTSVGRHSLVVGRY